MNGFCSTAGSAARAAPRRLWGGRSRTGSLRRAVRPEVIEDREPAVLAEGREDEVDRLSALRDEPERFREVSRLDHPVAVWLENVPQEEPHVLVVLDEQDGLGPPRTLRTPGGRADRGGCPRPPRRADTS